MDLEPDVKTVGKEDTPLDRFVDRPIPPCSIKCLRVGDWERRHLPHGAPFQDAVLTNHLCFVCKLLVIAYPDNTYED